MIFFDTTKTGRRGRRSGLDRVSARLRDSLGTQACEVVWNEGLRDLATGALLTPRAEDAFLTSELFSEAERPGFSDFLAARRCRLAGIFHDAIPLQHPQITWPQSVARHPSYMKLLAGFDRIWAVSEGSRSDLIGFWKWQGVRHPPPVEVLALGADFNHAPRALPPPLAPPDSRVASLPRLLCLGILEPRKNQRFLLDVCADLWAEGQRFELHIVGRVNPHFGAPIVSQLREVRRRWPKFLHFHEAASDATVATLFATSRATVFPTLAEGCGLPLLESLWRGVPCLCSDLPVLRENADAGGCVPVRVNDRGAWKDALQRVLTDDEFFRRLVTEAASRTLPTWTQAAETLAMALR